MQYEMNSHVIFVLKKTVETQLTAESVTSQIYTDIRLDLVPKSPANVLPRNIERVTRKSKHASPEATQLSRCEFRILLPSDQSSYIPPSPFMFRNLTTIHYKFLILGTSDNSAARCKNNESILIAPFSNDWNRFLFLTLAHLTVVFDC